MNALLTPQKPLNLKTVRVFRFIDGTTIIANLVQVDEASASVSLSGAVSLKEMRNSENGTIEGFITEPFMAPYSSFSPDKIVSFNLNHLLCSDAPSEMLAKNYSGIIKAALNAELMRDQETVSEPEEKIPGEDPLEPKEEQIH